jgi:hypothetical protein
VYEVNWITGSKDDHENTKIVKARKRKNRIKVKGKRIKETGGTLEVRAKHNDSARLPVVVAGGKV